MNECMTTDSSLDNNTSFLNIKECVLLDSYQLIETVLHFTLEVLDFHPTLSAITCTYNIVSYF